MEGIQYIRIAVAFLSLVIFSRLSFAAAKSSGFSIKLIPLDSRESPLYRGNLTQHERIERMANITLAKDKQTKLMGSTKNQNATFDDDKHFAALDRQKYFYTAQIMIGTPIQFVYLLVDTAGGLSWTQCQPCINCFPQSYPIYDPRASSTYQRLSCDHPRCTVAEGGEEFQCVNGNCVYSIIYGRGVNGPTRGAASFESFHLLHSQTGETDDFTLLFGCSNDNLNFDFEQVPDNKISGILGLNLHRNSFVSQLSDLIDDLFSYCIVPFDLDFPFDVHPHILRFGQDVNIPSGNIPTEHYVSVAGYYYYFVEVRDISVAGRSLQLPPRTYDVEFGPGFFFDSGAPFTVLSTRTSNGLNIFGMVMTALSVHYDAYKLMRVPKSHRHTPFRLCYFNRPNFRDFPSVTFHFGNSDYIIDGRFVNVLYKDDGFFCVAFIETSSHTVLGAVHMQNMRIIHNGRINAIHFMHEECSYDHL